MVGMGRCLDFKPGHNAEVVSQPFRLPAEPTRPLVASPARLHRVSSVPAESHFPKTTAQIEWVGEHLGKCGPVGIEHGFQNR